ncbi:aminoglycoside 6-adenylyltransferase [Bacillus sp. FJAT-26390]|uniref:aminoglycoside 6-adenylyltransferase n=1 Tax=Bacillus sp. FJAT-26390 TaxID=1743142 RepID=UPI000807AE39|nr:aminoglycoside 6-adenylyltransferase [Bacillus sp. FJAT-26390]OBZ08239.1 aminoglycoside adenylyltransferase [Bacillus sp. FJAT-26390]
MRSEKEMFDLILEVAQKDERIRAAYMNGSRTNPNVPKDIFQDYDIVYVVTETSSFVKDESWIKVFGELIIIHEPDKIDESLGMKMDFDRSYTYLMLFKDGNRIDLHIETKESMLEGYVKDKLTVPLLDKDNCLPSIPAPSDIDYHVKRPTEAAYIGINNEFWWCLQNVAKGIWRDELPYAKQMFEPSKKSLDEVVSWWIGMKYDFSISTGKMGKYFKNDLPGPYWELYKATYSDSSYEHMWDSIFAACDLFRTLSKEIAEAFSYSYPHNEDKNMTAYLERVRSLAPAVKS